jgi:Global regulator protein family
MLVLTRTIGEQIVIDGNIVVTVVAIDGNKIRLGIGTSRACWQPQRGRWACSRTGWSIRARTWD